MRKTQLLTIFLLIFALVFLNMASSAASRSFSNVPLIAAIENPDSTTVLPESAATREGDTVTTTPEPAETNSEPGQISAEAVPASRTSRLKPAPVPTPGPQDPAIQTNNLSSPSSPVTTPEPRLRTEARPARFEINIRTIGQWLSSWWNRTDFHLQLWYILCIIGLLLYLLRWNRLRQPFLFLCLILLGFYLGGPPDPVNAVPGLFIPGAGWWTALILLCIPVVISFLWGRVFCGWICPLGAVQEFLHIDSSKRQLPAGLDRFLKYVKYLILIALGYLTWRTGQNYWSNYEPSASLFTFNGSAVALMILGGFLLVSVLISRPFCRYICPLGAILAITSRIAPFKMRADADRCLVCNRCIQGICQMDAISAFNPEIDLPSISNAECITCGRCQKVCSKSALRITGFRIDRVYYSKTSRSQKIQ